jgi:mRNA interferase RelE/StbE
MKYKLKFLPSALKEWNKLGSTIKEQLKTKLKERLENPCNPKDKLSGLKDHYKIKLKTAGYRLVYKVEHSEICIIVIAVNKRNKDVVYKSAEDRNNQSQKQTINFEEIP